MRREAIEKHQVWVYLAAIAAGLAMGSIALGLGGAMEALIWPCLAALLYVTFTQVPLNRLSEAFRDMRFAASVLAANFVLVPLLVWALLPILPDEPAIRLGVLLVLLVPCTDWFITFAHLAGGDTRRAIAVTPVNLLAQFALLPVYLWFFLSERFVEIVSGQRIALVFVVLIALPLLLSFLTAKYAERRGRDAAIVERLAWFPVPLLALAVFLIAATQVDAVAGSLPVLGRLLPVFLLFLVGAVAIGMVVARVFRLPLPQARALVFSVATRNSLVVLPFALALPAAWEMAAIVIVFQSLVELLGMVALLWLVPRRLLAMPRPAS